MSKKKNVQVTEFALSEALSKGNEFVREQKSALNAETYVLSLDEKIERAKRSLGSRIEGIVNSFNRYKNAVSKKIEKGYTIKQVVTPEIKKNLIQPYEDYVNSKLGSSSIPEALDKQNEKRKRDLRLYGRTNELKEKINHYHDVMVSKFILPLKWVEVELNNFTPISGERKAIQSMASKMLLETFEDAKIVEEEAKEAREKQKEESKKKTAFRKAYIEELEDKGVHPDAIKKVKAMKSREFWEFVEIQDEKDKDKAKAKANKEKVESK